MNTKRKTLKMPVRYLMNLVLVGLLFVGLSYVTGNMLSTYQNKVLLTVGINIILAVSLNVATGYLGQLPLGHGRFYGRGCLCLRPVHQILGPAQGRRLCHRSGAGMGDRRAVRGAYRHPWPCA